MLERRAARAFGLKDYDKAIEALSDLLHVVGENPNTLHVTAVCHQRLGQDEKALGFAERGVTADPVHLGCLEVLTEIHAARGDMDAAAQFARRALERIEILSASAHSSRSARAWLAAMFKKPVIGTPPPVLKPEWVTWASQLLEGRSDVGKS